MNGGILPSRDASLAQGQRKTGLDPLLDNDLRRAPSLPEHVVLALPLLPKSGVSTKKMDVGMRLRGREGGWFPSEGTVT
jgi:hypothetical protein